MSRSPSLVSVHSEPPSSAPSIAGSSNPPLAIQRSLREQQIRYHARLTLFTALNGPILVPLAVGVYSRIYRIPGTDNIVKEALYNDPTLPKEILDVSWREMVAHRTVQRAFRMIGYTGVHLPRHYRYLGTVVRPDRVDEELDLRASLVFPHHDNTKRALNVMEEIPSLPKRVRRALIEVFFEDEVQKMWLRSQMHEQCLVYVMMGKQNQTMDSERSSLHGFELCVNHLVDLKIDVLVVTQTLGKLLAILHWIAAVDGKGIKFVLGAPPKSSHYDMNIAQKDDGMNRKNRPVHLWMMGLNQASLIPRAEFINKTVPAFLGNKDFWPRPARDAQSFESTIWAVFCDAYLDWTKVIRGVGGDSLDLATRFLDEVEAHFGTGPLSDNPSDEEEWEDSIDGLSLSES